MVPDPRLLPPLRRPWRWPGGLLVLLFCVTTAGAGTPREPQPIDVCLQVPPAGLPDWADPAGVRALGFDTLQAEWHRKGIPVARCRSSDEATASPPPDRLDIYIAYLTGQPPLTAAARRQQEELRQEAAQWEARAAQLERQVQQWQQALSQLPPGDPVPGVSARSMEEPLRQPGILRMRMGPSPADMQASLRDAMRQRRIALLERDRFLEQVEALSRAGRTQSGVEGGMYTRWSLLRGGNTVAGGGQWQSVTLDPPAVLTDPSVQKELLVALFSELATALATPLGSPGGAPPGDAGPPRRW